jgi:hypothetical protein
VEEKCTGLTLEELEAQKGELLPAREEMYNSLTQVANTGFNFAQTSGGGGVGIGTGAATNYGWQSYKGYGY